ncbi:Hypothetical protein POVN_LOCUS254 [uncultured virus]|nr:Hypothetical protein POVN_LOCUS254 [uncultured virus]
MSETKEGHKLAVEQFLDLAQRANALMKVRNQKEAKALYDWISQPTAMSTLGALLQEFFLERSELPATAETDTMMFYMYDPGNDDNKNIELDVSRGTTVAQVVEALAAALDIQPQQVLQLKAGLYLNKGSKLKDDEDIFDHWTRGRKTGFSGEFRRYQGKLRGADRQGWEAPYTSYTIPAVTTGPGYPKYLRVLEGTTVKRELEYEKGKDLLLDGVSLMPTYADQPLLELLRSWPTKINRIEFTPL